MSAKRRWPRAWSIALLTGAMLGASQSGPALAQPAGSLDRHESAVLPSDGVGVNTAETTGDMRWGANLQVDYANDPAVLEDANGRRARVVSHQLRGHLTGSLTLRDRAVVYLGLPVDLLLSGIDTVAAPGVPPATGANVGDPYLGARIRLLGTLDDTFMLAVQAQLSFPLAQMIERPTYSGDPTLGGSVSVIPQLNLGMARLAFDVGGRWHRATNYPDSALDSELRFGAGLTLTPSDDLPLVILAELRGSTAFKPFADREQTAFEALAGVRYTHEDTGLAFGAAGGTGLNPGLGVPDYRLLATIGFQSNPGDRDSDGDGLANGVDTCPDDAEDQDGFEDQDGCPDTDNDQDGVADATDACRDEAEDRDSFADDDGCPDTDNDQDQVLDANDGAPNEPEDRDEYQDDDGVPDPDNDEDGVPDAADAAPLEPEDRDGFEDEDGRPEDDNDQDGIHDNVDHCPNETGPVANRGCPDRDRDGDTVVDRLDSCPEEAGTVANQGCRVRQLVTIESDRIVILTRVYFQTGSAAIQRRSFGLLDNVASVLAAHPEITMVRIEGHTDARGNADDNMRLSQERAQSVLDYLAGHGVDRARLRAQGFGPTQPRVATPRTNREHEENRRVEFVIEGM